MSTDLTIIPIETPSLGNRSYVVHDGSVAFVVDPQRDIDRVLDVLDEHRVRLSESSRPTSTTTTSPAASRSPVRPARRTASTPRTKCPSLAHRFTTARP